MTETRTRKARTIWIVAAGVVVLAVLAAVFGPIIYRDWIVGPAADTPQEQLAEQTPQEDASSGSEIVLGAGEWVAGAGSYAGYRVDEVLNGVDVTVTGRTEDVTGTVSTSDTAVTAATFEVDVASITTDQPNRDSYFRSNAINTSQFPTATFTLATPIEAAADLALGAQTEVDAAGTLTMNGVSREVTLRVAVAPTANAVTVAGQIPITFADFGVTAPNLGFVSVEDSGFVEFSLVLQPA